jgi:hypothetical protein
VEGLLSQSLESVVRILVGESKGVTAVILSGRIVSVGVDDGAEVDVVVRLSAVTRRVPAQILGL